MCKRYGVLETGRKRVFEKCIGSAALQFDIIPWVLSGIKQIQETEPRVEVNTKEWG
jgi:hypothetical protein